MAGFHYFTKQKAELRQDPADGLGTKCARCGDRMGRFTIKKHCNYIPIKPIELGGNYKLDNCAVICNDCAGILKACNNIIIPIDELPFYKLRNI